jgi:hypothetical protein
MNFGFGTFSGKAASISVLVQSFGTDGNSGAMVASGSLPHAVKNSNAERMIAIFFMAKLSHNLIAG